jgi:hypothetical protein
LLLTPESDFGKDGTEAMSPRRKWSPRKAAMSDPISDSLKPRPDQRPSDERFPTPWALERRDRDTYIRDAGENSVACDMPYYPWIETEAMPLIVHRVNSFDSLLEACRAAKEHVAELREAWQRGCISEHDGKGGTRSNRNADLDLMLSRAISSAEKQP